MTTNFSNFIDAVRKVKTVEGVEHLSKQLRSYQRQPDCLTQTVALFADVDPEVVQRVVAVIGAAHLHEHSTVRKGVILLIKRTDLSPAVARFAVRILIDAVLNRDETAHDALLTYVKQGGDARTHYEVTLATYVSSDQRAKELRRINAASQAVMQNGGGI